MRRTWGAMCLRACVRVCVCVYARVYLVVFVLYFECRALSGCAAIPHHMHAVIIYHRSSVTFQGKLFWTYIQAQPF